MEMRTYRSMKHATQSLALDHDLKPLHMFIKACENDIFKKPMQEGYYSHEWLKHHLYLNPNIEIFKKLVSIFPPEHDFKIRGYEKEFLANKND